MHLALKIRHFQQYFSYIVAVSFIGKENRSARRNTTDQSEVTDKLYYIFCYSFLNLISICICLEHPSAGFTYRLGRLKPRTSNIRGPQAKLYHFCNIVIGLSHFCHNVVVLSKQPYNNFPYTVVLHFRILLNFKHPFIKLD